MTRFAVCLTVLLTLFIAGCVPSTTQHQNKIDAINNKTILTGYTRDYIISKFGPPSEVVDKPSGTHGQIWIYKTTSEQPSIVINFKAPKTKAVTRYIKLLVVGNTVLDSNYE